MVDNVDDDDVLFNEASSITSVVLLVKAIVVVLSVKVTIIK